MDLHQVDWAHLITSSGFAALTWYLIVKHIPNILRSFKQELEATRKNCKEEIEELVKDRKTEREDFLRELQEYRKHLLK